MGYFLSLITALLFGINPTVITKAKTRPFQQLISTSIALFIFGAIIFACTSSNTISELTSGNMTQIILVSMLCGFVYSFAQVLQYKTLDLLGPAKGFALSTASILVFNALFSVIIFKEWQTPYQLGLGFGSIFVIIIGVFVISYREKKKNSGDQDTFSQNKEKMDFILGLMIVIIQGLLFSVYLLAPRYLYNAGVTSFTIIPFQGLGTLVGTGILCIIIIFVNKYKSKKDENYVPEVIVNKRSIYGLSSGLVQCLANLCLLIANSYIPSAVANSLSQLCVIFSTFFSLLVLKEYKGKTKKELICMIVGSIIVGIGGVAIGFTGLNL